MHNLDGIINELFMNYKLPTMIFDTNIIKSNINKLKHDLSANNIFFSYPVKVCSNQLILKLFNDNDFFFDVANLDEFNSVKLLSPKKVFMNDPSYQPNFSNDYITIINNINSVDLPKSTTFSLRINFNGLYTKTSRFGTPLLEIINNNMIVSKLEYIHFHFAHQKNFDFIKIAKEALLKIIPKAPLLKGIIIGGGWSFDKLDLLYSLVSELSKYTPIIIEAGDLWFNDAGYIITKVVDKKLYENKNYITLDISKMLHCNWSSPMFKKNLTNNNRPIEKVENKFYGKTCYEYDVFEDINSHQLIEINDILLLNNINIYSLSLNFHFNGIKEAKVYIL